MNGESIEVLATRLDEYRKGHDQRHKQEYQALQSQNTENLRRLDELNHAHAQATIDKAQFLTIAVFDAKQDALVRRIDTMQHLMSERAIENAGLQQQVATLRLIVYGAVLLALTAVAGAILQLVVLKKG